MRPSIRRSATGWQEERLDRPQGPKPELSKRHEGSTMAKPLLGSTPPGTKVKGTYMYICTLLLINHPVSRKAASSESLRKLWKQANSALGQAGGDQLETQVQTYKRY